MPKPFRNRMSKKKFKYARNLRKKATKSEKILWKELRSWKAEVKFRFQCPMLGWIVDFWCPSRNLIIELDGAFHENKKAEDEYRDKVISEYMGAKILRIESSRIFTDFDNCVAEIRETIKNQPKMF